MKLSKPRLEPIPETQWSDKVKETLREIKARQGEVPNIFKTLAHHPDLMRRWLVFGNHAQALHVLLSTFLGRSSVQTNVPETASRREATSGRPIETLEKRLRRATLSQDRQLNRAKGSPTWV